MTQDHEDDSSPANDYERWLEDLAGGPVAVWRMITLWIALGLGVYGVFAGLGAESDVPAGIAVAVLSGAYWGWAIPRWARRKGEQRRTRGL